MELYAAVGSLNAWTNFLKNSNLIDFSDWLISFLRYFFLRYLIYYVCLAILDVLPNLRNDLKRGDAFEEQFFKGIKNYTL